MLVISLIVFLVDARPLTHISALWRFKLRQSANASSGGAGSIRWALKSSQDTRVAAKVPRLIDFTFTG